MPLLRAKLLLLTMSDLPDNTSSATEAEESTNSKISSGGEPIVKIQEPIQVIYCPKCTWPCEFWLVIRL